MLPELAHRRPNAYGAAVRNGGRASEPGGFVPGADTVALPYTASSRSAANHPAGHARMHALNYSCCQGTCTSQAGADQR